MKRQGGFNLVELAIVMVIIGLLVGGVLKGQALVTSAKIKRVNNDFNGITAAVYTYLDRYSALPGDDDKAEARWTDGVTDITAGATMDQGNGTLEGNWTDTDPATSEARLLWEHLYNATLVGSDNIPTNAFGGTVGVQEGPTISGVDFKLNGIVVCMDIFDGDVAEVIDVNFDDGVPETGLLRAVTKASDGTLGTALATAYTPASGYVICKRI
jgi:prepilin-type N-terminal cleavage/methylation domain-containing protein